jgi:FMN phosphatase YigB (HAD superfamily)
MNAYLSSLGIPEVKQAAAVDALDPVWSGPRPSSGGASSKVRLLGCRSLAEADLQLAIVSNSDGRAREALQRNKICQVGPGPGVKVVTIIDSDVVGVAKPDPRIFDFALPALSLDPSQVIYVGDSVKYDVRSAEAARMTALHLDPFGLCYEVGHAHFRAVADVIHHT